ncbi:MAG: FtsX-like permease family protein [Kiritimatiellia bacterium]
MIVRLTLKGLARGKARFACAALGVAAACGVVVFMFSLAATNAAQAPALAKRAVAPWVAWTVDGSFGRGRPAPSAARPPRAEPGRPDLRMELVGCSIDYRPGGRVLQGPPMLAVIASAPKENPYRSAPLVEGRWVEDASPVNEIVCTRTTFRRFGRGEPPPLGTEIKFVGQRGTMSAKIVGYLADVRLPTGWPGVFANTAAFGGLADEVHGSIRLWQTMPDVSSPRLLTAESESVVAVFKGDEQRRMDYARPLMLVAAVLTALCLLVNSLLLSIESNRRPLATLRTVGVTRGGVLALVAAEAFLATLVGSVGGCLGAIAALVVYVSADPAAFPMGPSVAWGVVAAALVLAVAVALLAVLCALRPALSVRPLDALESRPHRRRRGMAVAFACGFAAFVAVEVWGASLMRGFVPSGEWPDAIVSILPEGVSAFDIEKLRKLPGVKRISELCPLQLNFDPEEELPLPPGRGGMAGRGGAPRKPCRNALFLAAEWLPRFKFVEGAWEAADQAIRSSDGCVIAEMISRARNLHVGDRLRVALPGRGPKTVAELPIVGVVDLNWHMVTSRGLVRGLNGAPVMTDGPVFVSFDTLESLDPRPATMTKMTHLWVEYDPAFLKEKGVFPAGRAVEAAIAKALGLDARPLQSAQPASTVRLHARDEIADGTLAHGSDVVGQAARVPFVFLAILSLGFIAMLVADADAAKRAFAVLRAVGATRGQLAARLAGGALKTAGLGVALGGPLGAVAGWLFSLKTGSLWPGLPHYFEVPWAVIGEGSLVALTVVLLIAVPTALTLVIRFSRHA